ncbi:YcaO-like family protein [Brevibacterium aurantiacum]|uniref:YcaO-like family protein n=1 Tax=Brevibacterium aurantiacum TaxID=273384 RepID=A0A2H1K7G4_BREAU|nr:YcaO-like family protein [Brevibacterium aurantiacum]
MHYRTRIIQTPDCLPVIENSGISLWVSATQISDATLLPESEYSQNSANIRRWLDGYGHAATPELSMTKCVAEANEGYTTALTGLYCRPHFISPQSIFRYTNFDINDMIAIESVDVYKAKLSELYGNLGWICATDLINQALTLVPAQVILGNYRMRNLEPRLQRGTSRGLACAYSEIDAILHGMLEVIETDSFTRFMQSDQALTTYAFESEGEFSYPKKYGRQPEIRSYERINYWRIPTEYDEVYVILSSIELLVDGQRCALFGMGSGFEIESAASHARAEAVHMMLRSPVKEIRKIMNLSESELISLSGREYYKKLGCNKRYLNWLTETKLKTSDSSSEDYCRPARNDISSKQCKLDMLIRCAKRLRWDWYCANISRLLPQEYDEQTHQVYKVYSPQAEPLDLGTRTYRGVNADGFVRNRHTYPILCP